jgi:hypothetical protein
MGVRFFLGGGWKGSQGARWHNAVAAQTRQHRCHASCCWWAAGEDGCYLQGP